MPLPHSFARARNAIVRRLLLVFCIVAATSCSRSADSEREDPQTVDGGLVVSDGSIIATNRNDSATPVSTAGAAPRVRLSADGPVSLCLGACVRISALAERGIPPYQYTFDQGVGEGPGPHQVCPRQTTTYSVTARDSSFDGEFGGRNPPAVDSLTLQVDASCVSAPADAGWATDASTSNQSREAGIDASVPVVDASVPVVDASVPVLDANIPSDGQPGAPLCNRRVAWIEHAHDQSSYFDIWNDDFGSKLALGAGQQPVLAVTFKGTLNLEGGASVSAGDGLAILVAKLNADCSLLWYKTLRGYEGAHEPVVALDSKGRIVVLGSTQTEHPVDSFFSINAIYLASLSPDGVIQWEKRIESAPGLQWQRALRIDANDDIVIMTAAQSGSDFGGGAMGPLGVVAQDPTVTVLAKYRSTGMHVWSKMLTEGPTRSALAIQNGTDVVFHGWSEIALDWGAGGRTVGSQGSASHGYLVRANANGVFQWSKVVSQARIEQYASHWLDVNRSNQMVFTNLAASGELALATANGDLLWRKAVIGLPGSPDQWRKTAVDARGNVFVGGTFSDQTSVNGVVLTGAPDYDAFVQKVDANGAVQWTFQSTSVAAAPTFGEELLGMAPDNNDNAFALLKTRRGDIEAMEIVKIAR